MSINNAALEFQKLWQAAQVEYAQREREWIADLRARGIVAAHPDDGWVNRDLNEIFFAYPQFDDGVRVGARVALGEPYGKTRIIQLTGVSVRRSILSGMKFWKFSEVSDADR